MHKRKAYKKLQLTEQNEGFEEDGKDGKTVDIMKTRVQGILSQYTISMRSAIRQTMDHKLDEEKEEEEAGHKSSPV